MSFPHATSTLGTFTAKYRGGFWKRVWRVLRTVRYYPGVQAWKNKLGLPNPGVDWLSGKTYPDKIISIMGFNDNDWQHCLDVALACNPLAIELNVSCPNCPGEDGTDYAATLPSLVKKAGVTEIIVKLPPVGYEKRLEAALTAGISSYHCCNTLPTPGGGMSGKPLKLLSLSCAATVLGAAKTYNVNLKRLIGGGGITHKEDALEYLAAGCTNVAVASSLFNPLGWARIKKIALDISTVQA